MTSLGKRWTLICEHLRFLEIHYHLYMLKYIEILPFIEKGIFIVTYLKVNDLGVVAHVCNSSDVRN